MPLFHPMDSSSPYPWDCITIPWDSTTRSLRTLEQPHSWDSTNLPLGFQHPTPEIPLSPFWYSIATPLRFHYPALRISAPLSWLLVYGSQKSFFASRASPIALLLPCSNLQTPLFNELLKISCNDFYNSKNPSKFFFFCQKWTCFMTLNSLCNVLCRRTFLRFFRHKHVHAVFNFCVKFMHCLRHCSCY